MRVISPLDCRCIIAARRALIDADYALVGGNLAEEPIPVEGIADWLRVIREALETGEYEGIEW